MDAINQMTGLVSLHLISGNQTLNSSNGLYKQIGPDHFLETNKLIFWRPA